MADLADETSTLGVGFSKTAYVTDESSGLASGLWEKVSGTGNVVFSNPTATTTTITPDTASDSYTIKYTATDNAGYTVSDTFTFVWDTSVLTANITSHTNIYTASSTSLSGIANGDSVLWSAVDSKVKFTSATTSSTDVSIDPSTEGVYTIKFTTKRGADSAEDTMELHWDLTPPQIDTPIALDGATVGGYINEDDVAAAEFSLVTTGASSDPNNTSGILSEEYLLTLASEACSSIANNDSRWTEIVPKNIDLNVLADGVYHVCFRSTDRSGLITLQSAAPSFTLDTLDPAYVSGFALETNIADGYLNKNESNTASANLVSALVASSGDIVEYAVTLQTSDCSLATYSSTIPKADDGHTDATNYKVCARITDLAGNTPLYMENASFLVDTQVPVISSVSLTNTNIEDGKLDNLEALLSSDLYAITAAGYTSLESAIVVTSPRVVVELPTTQI